MRWLLKWSQRKLFVHRRGAVASLVILVFVLVMGHKTLKRQNRTFPKVIEDAANTQSPTSNPNARRQDVETALNDDALFVVQVVTKAHYQDFATTSDAPPCVGVRQETEVEDILCIPRPDYLKEVKNPCWWESGERNVSLSCLPYFHILGCSKCASTDLWKRITAHPHVTRNRGVFSKEADWWAWGRYGKRNYRKHPIEDFKHYTRMFTPLSTKISSSIRKRDNLHTFFITGDATPSDFWDVRGWPNITQNRGLQLPRVLTPHLMKHFYRKPKFILILRDPIDRQYSDYFFINKGKSNQTFHNAVLKSIQILAQCMRFRTVRECLYSDHIFKSLPTRLNFIFYSLYLMEWLKVFPKENFLFLKTEEYQQDIQAHLKTCMDFLDLEPLNNETMADIAGQHNVRVTNRKGRAGKMLPETRTILEELTRPSRVFLADLIGDDKFKWE